LEVETVDEVSRKTWYLLTAAPPSLVGAVHARDTVEADTVAESEAGALGEVAGDVLMRPATLVRIDGSCP